MKNLLYFLLFCCTFAQAQKAPFKYGKLDQADLKMKSCAFYPEANSMVLGEYGELTFKRSDENGWQYEMKVIVRKKVFNKLDKDIANQKIRIYQPVSGGNKQSVIGLRGVTYNLKNGETEKTKLDKAAKFENRINDYWVDVGFAMPNVQDGSVIEYSYTLLSDYLTNLYSWHFQDDIPTAYSEFRFTIPEFFSYHAGVLGTVLPLEDETSDRPETFSYSWQSAPQTGGKIERGITTLESNSKMRRIIAKEVPPVMDEPFINNKKDIPTRIAFQLVSYQMPNQAMTMVAGTYESFNKSLLESDYFGLRLKRGNFAKERIESLQGKSDYERAEQLHHWLKNHFTWNGYGAFRSEHAGINAFRAGEGNIADINLSFVAALREAGLQAYPVILSTRGHGTPHAVYPNDDDFDYVVAAIVIDEKTYFADAGSPLLPFGMLPKRCLNGHAWMVAEMGGQWVDLSLNAKTETIALITTQLNENGTLQSDVKVKRTGYAALKTLETWKKEGEEKFSANLAEEFEEWELSDFEMEEGAAAERLKMNFKLSRSPDDADLIYLNPFPYACIKKNPFVRKERNSVVDFPTLISQKVIANIALPEGYTAELPEATALKLPDGGSFTLSATQNEQNISIVSQFKQSKTLFSPKEYDALKQFYELMAEKNRQLIVLKKE